MGRNKIDPRMSTIFLNKSIKKHHWQQHWFDGRSKTTLLWTSMLSNIWDSAVILAQAFSVAQMFQNGSKVSGESDHDFISSSEGYGKGKFI